MTSLCDACYAPGACCRSFTLSNRDGRHPSYWAGDPGDHDDGARAFLAEHGLPFEVEGWYNATDEASGRDYVYPRFRCPELGADGRCTIYDRRPDPCREMEPAGSGLCVHYHGAESDERGML